MKSKMSKKKKISIIVLVCFVTLLCFIFFKKLNHFLYYYAYSVPHVNNFGQSLVKNLEKSEEDNIVISPFSVNSALLVAATGANKTTFSEFVKVLHIDNLDSPKAILGDKEIIDSNHGRKSFVSSNSVWISKNINVFKNYTDSVKSTFDSSVFHTDFLSSKTVEQINNWVSESTNGTVTNAIDKISPDYLMLLVNTLYFNGEWKNKFEPGKSSTEAFVLADDEKYTLVRFMRTIHKYDYYRDDHVTAALLPLTSGPQLLVVKPHRRGAESLRAVVDTYLTHTMISSAVSNSHSTRLDLKLPCFDVSYSLSLTGPLKELGLVSAFSASTASFPFISDDSLFISDVVHQVVFTVDEIGVKAAAATEVVIEKSLSPAPSFDVESTVPFYVDRPFVFVLLDGKTALFMGVIRDVNAEEVGNDNSSRSAE